MKRRSLSQALRFVGLVSSTVAIAGCSGETRDASAGDASASGGTSGAAGATGKAGGGGSGGASGTGGATGTGGAVGSGGASGSGGATGSGGASDGGGAAGKGGDAGSGGTSGDGGGAAGKGDAAGSGGASGIGGAAGSSDSGGAGKGGMAGRDAGNADGGSAGTGGSSGDAGSCSTPPASDAVIGWAAVSGMGQNAPTTGGGTAAPQTVTTLAALNTAAAGSTAAVIYVRGILAPGNLSIGSNKTIVGLCGAEIHGHVGVSGSSNVIVRNIKIVGYGVGDCSKDPGFDPAVGCSSGDDAITIGNNAHHVWFDHCDVSDGTDGNLDVTSGADFVTISWTKFHYTPRTDNVGNDSTGAAGHRFSNLIGSADDVPGDVGHLNVTWHHNWWAENVNQRMPRTRNGRIHLFNNLFTSTGNTYCTNSGFQATLLVENNIYDGVANPLQPDVGNMKALNNVFTNTTGTKTASGTGFAPTYAYTAEATTNLAAAIRAGAGPH
jgi:pectate lyase